MLRCAALGCTGLGWAGMGCGRLHWAGLHYTGLGLLHCSCSLQLVTYAPLRPGPISNSTSWSFISAGRALRSRDSPTAAAKNDLFSQKTGFVPFLYACLEPALANHRTRGGGGDDKNEWCIMPKRRFRTEISSMAEDFFVRRQSALRIRDDKTKSFLVLRTKRFSFCVCPEPGLANDRFSCMWKL